MRKRFGLDEQRHLEQTAGVSGLASVEDIGAAVSEAYRAVLHRGHSVHGCAGDQLPKVVPVAIQRLSGNPLLEGDMFPGDLLVAVLRLPDRVWEKQPEWRRAVDAIVEQLERVPDQIADAVENFQQFNKAVHLTTASGRG